MLQDYVYTGHGSSLARAAGGLNTPARPHPGMPHHTA